MKQIKGWNPLVCLCLCLQACSHHQGPVTDHFDGTRFHLEGTRHSTMDMVRWLWEMETIPWPEWIDDPKQPAPPARVAKGELWVTHINHATILIQMDEMNILTDPVWSSNVGPFGRLGPGRIRNPGVSLQDLPQIDLILISHDHWDHLDLPSILKIYKRDKPLIITGLGVDKILIKNGLSNVKALDWWQQVVLEQNQIHVTFVPAVHSSGRWPLMDNRTLWGGFVISSDHGNVYFAGDTGFGDFLEKIAQEFGRFRLAVLPVGSYEKRWFMKNQHMNPEDAVNAHLTLNALQSIGMHFATFAEHPEQSVDAHEKDLEAALIKYGIHYSEFRIPEFGQGLSVGKL